LKQIDSFGKNYLPCSHFYPVILLKKALSLWSALRINVGLADSSGIFTFRDDYIEKMGCTMRSSRIMVRQPMVSGNGGAFFNGMPSTVTLGCGTWGNNITTENIHWKHFINVTWLSLPIEAQSAFQRRILRLLGALWPMKLHEYQAKSFFKEYGIPVPEGILADSLDSVLQAAAKNQISLCAKKPKWLHGGRGKAGLVKSSETKQEARVGWPGPC